MNLDLKINFSKKDKILKKDNYQLNADKYWKIILTGSFVLISAFFIFGFILFQKTSKELEVKIDSNDTNSIIVRRERIDKVLEIFSEREKKSREIILSPSGIVDPSI